MPNRSSGAPKAAPDKPAKIGDYPDRPLSAAEDKTAAERHHDYRPDGKPVEQPATISEEPTDG